MVFVDYPSHLLDYFTEDYVTSRNQFIEFSLELKTINPNLEVGRFRIPSRIDTDLTIDYTILPSLKKTKYSFILISGMHGVEAGAGTAIQRHFLKEVYTRDINKERTSVLLVHSINPFGYKYNRRVTENNIDLNRNFLKNKKGFQKKNDGYPKIFEFLNPKHPVETRTLRARLFVLKALYTIFRMGIPAIKQASLQGQYEYPEGIYYGGMNFEPIRKLIGKLIRDFAKRSQRVLIVDIHTGYGERGKLHFFPSDPKKPRYRVYTEKLFEGYKIDWASDEDFYEVTGDLCTYVYKILPKKSIVVPMVFEYGTMDTHTTFGAIESLKRLIRENQGYFYGYKTHEDRFRTMGEFLEMFYPSDPNWRKKILLDTDSVWKIILPRFQSEIFFQS